MKKFIIYSVFIGLIFLVGMTSAFIAPPGPWYDGLNKPWFNPPDWLFPVGWTILYIIIGIAGARIWLAGLLGAPLLFWIAQLGLNGLWSYLFFGLQSPGLALGEVILLLGSILGFIKTSWVEERVAALFFIPYAAWVTFAAILNATIFFMN